MKIRYELLEKAKRRKPSTTLPPFGIERVDHIFIMNYDDGEWHDPRIVPYGPLPIMPGAICLGYGQAYFDGGKSFRHPDGEVYAWRFDLNAERVNVSSNILIMPTVPVELQVEACLRILDVERDLVPSMPEASMYVRPIMIGLEDCIGVRPSKNFMYYLLLSPSGPYFTSGFKSTTLLITRKYHRAMRGGMGNAKAAGNYAASLRPHKYAKDNGADQVLYLDVDNEYIEEAGTMNHFHVLKDGTFVIPAFNDSILHSITTKSVMELAEMGKLKAHQEPIKINDFIKGVKSGEIIEAGGLGTAAVINPVGKYIFDDGTEPLIVGNGQPGKHTRALYELYSGMQTGKVPAPEGWCVKVPHYGK